MNCTLTKWSTLTSPIKEQIYTMCLLIRHRETHHYFCSILAKTAEQELHEEIPHKSDIGTLLNNWFEFLKNIKVKKYKERWETVYI